MFKGSGAKYIYHFRSITCCLNVLNLNAFIPPTTSVPHLTSQQKQICHLFLDPTPKKTNTSTSHPPILFVLIFFSQKRMNKKRNVQPHCQLSRQNVNPKKSPLHHCQGFGPTTKEKNGHVSAIGFPENPLQPSAPAVLLVKLAPEAPAEAAVFSSCHRGDVEKPTSLTTFTGQVCAYLEV